MPGHACLARPDHARLAASDTCGFQSDRAAATAIDVKHRSWPAISDVTSHTHKRVTQAVQVLIQYIDEGERWRRGGVWKRLLEDVS
jgi:hypothetical protein